MVKQSSPVSVLLLVDTPPLCPQQEKLRASTSFHVDSKTPDLSLKSLPFFCSYDDERPTSSNHDDHDDHDDITLFRSQLNDKQQQVLSRVEQRLQIAQQEAIRQRAIVLLYQDEFRSLTTQRRLNEDPDFDTEKWRERRRSMHHLQEVTREHSALVALRERTLELESLKEIAVRGETRIVRLEIENTMLEQALQEERQQKNRLEKERNALNVENRKWRAKAETFGQRMKVAEHERNYLRRRHYLTSDL
jgi:hypothetical protein